MENRKKTQFATKAYLLKSTAAQDKEIEK